MGLEPEQLKVLKAICEKDEQKLGEYTRREIKDVENKMEKLREEGRNEILDNSNYDYVVGDTNVIIKSKL